jgi:hypothetical protein
LNRFTCETVVPPAAVPGNAAPLARATDVAATVPFTLVTVIAVISAALAAESSYLASVLSVTFIDSNSVFNEVQFDLVFVDASVVTAIIPTTTSPLFN